MADKTLKDYVQYDLICVDRIAVKSQTQHNIVQEHNTNILPVLAVNWKLKEKNNTQLLFLTKISAFNPFLHEYSCSPPPTMNNYINKLLCWYIEHRNN